MTTREKRLERLFRELDDMLEALESPGRAEGILCAVAAGSQALLQEADVGHGIEQAMAVLGKVAAIERISVFRIDEGPTCVRLHVYTAPSVDTTELDLGGPLSPERLGAREWEDAILRGEVVRAVTGELSVGPLRARLEHEGIQALVLVPIFMDGVWGFIGCYDLRAPYLWNRGEVCALTLLAASIGAALGRVAREQERLETERLWQRSNRLESLALLAGGVGHDLNNLLTVLRFELAGARGADAALLQVVDRVSDMTKQLVVYARGGSIEQRGACDVAGLVRETCRLLRSSLVKGVRIDPTRVAPTPPVSGDASQIRQVALNLITNAIEAMPDEGGTVSVRTGVAHLDAAQLAAAVHAENAAPGEFVEVAVEDNGIGMDRETATRIFDPYFSTKETGTGFGLATVVGILRGHHGVVSLVSEPGVGTTVTAYFPMATIG